MTPSSIDRDAKRIRYAMAVFFALLALANLAMRERISTLMVRPETWADHNADPHTLSARFPSGRCGLTVEWYRGTIL